MGSRTGHQPGIRKRSDRTTKENTHIEITRRWLNGLFIELRAGHSCSWRRSNGWPGILRETVAKIVFHPAAKPFCIHACGGSELPSQAQRKLQGEGRPPEKWPAFAKIIVI